MAQKTYKGISPIKVPENEKIVSITLPSEASSITTLDIPETATIDVTACNESTQDTIRQQYKTTNNVSTSKTWVTYNDGTEESFDITEITSRSPSTYEEYSQYGSYIPNEIPKVRSVRSIILGKKVTSIGRGAFFRCSGLTSITIPDSVTKIGDTAFMDCSGLTSITIPDSVTKIDDTAFYICSGLTSITIPNSVTSIGSSAFNGCNKLISIIFNGTTE